METIMKIGLSGTTCVAISVYRIVLCECMQLCVRMKRINNVSNDISTHINERDVTLKDFGHSMKKYINIQTYAHPQQQHG